MQTVVSSPLSTAEAFQGGKRMGRGRGNRVGDGGHRGGGWVDQAFAGGGAG